MKCRFLQHRLPAPEELEDLTRTSPTTASHYIAAVNGAPMPVPDAQTLVSSAPSLASNERQFHRETARRGRARESAFQNAGRGLVGGPTKALKKEPTGTKRR